MVIYAKSLERDRLNWKHCRHSRESGNPGTVTCGCPWAPAFAGATMKCFDFNQSRASRIAASVTWLKSEKPPSRFFAAARVSLLNGGIRRSRKLQQSIDAVKTSLSFARRVARKAPTRRRGNQAGAFSWWPSSVGAARV